MALQYSASVRNNQLDQVEATAGTSARRRISTGGAPADRSIVQAIAELKARGFRVVLYPFVMMDVPAGNSRPWSRSR